MASDTVWVCKDCNLFYTRADVTERHFASVHKTKVKAEEWGEVTELGSVSDGPTAEMLEAFLPAYKKRVEQEFAEAICSLLELAAEGKAAAAGTAGTLEDSLDAAAAARALRDFVPSVRVMADLPPGT